MPRVTGPVDASVQCHLSSSSWNSASFRKTDACEPKIAQLPGAVQLSLTSPRSAFVTELMRFNLDLRGGKLASR